VTSVIRPETAAGNETAELLYALVVRLLGRPVGFRLTTWESGAAGPGDAPLTVHLKSPRALRRVLWQPNELGLARAYVSGDLAVEGDLVAALSAPLAMSTPAASSAVPVRRSRRLRFADLLAAVRAARRTGALGLPVKAPAGEVRLRGGLHSLRRDAAAISHHYDVGNDFYRLLLDESMTYSCAYWVHDPSPAYTLADAQADKYELICRKLGLHEGMRLLDVGCGWGGMLLHAATRHGVSGVGITLSREQAALARQRISDAGVADRIEVRLCDYRELGASGVGEFDAISSIGMAEHVGAKAFLDYTTTLHGLLVDGGRLLNHQISRPAGLPGTGGPSFIDRYIFPDGELLPVGEVVSVIENAGFEVRDVESLRENYYLTLLQWLANLHRSRDAAIELVGAERVRTWELYIAGSAAAFGVGHIGIHQTLAVKPVAGDSGLPRIRAQWLCG
jgi:cyclopropane-fatty-acyl-phospholipid synthase